LLAGLTLVSVTHAKVHVKIAANGAAIDAFNNWTAATGWAEIRNFKSGNASRPAVDLVLQLQALKAGGLDFDFEFVRTLTYELAKTEVVQGRADLSGETIWDSEIAEQSSALAKGPVIIRNGEFVKGVYALPTNQKLLALTTLEQLREYAGAVVGTWALDVQTMEALKLKGLVKKPTPELVFTAIKAGQADFTLAEFSSSADMAVELAGVKLLPVPNAKVAIAGSRSWCVAKSSPRAAELVQALVAGEKVLRTQGTIERAFQESGFFNPRVAAWQRLQ
jgi:hypothetical protein